MAAEMSYPLTLKAQQIEKVCLFELSWGRGQQLSATVPFPPLLMKLYQEWRRVYLKFYEQTEIATFVVPAQVEPPLRGRAIESGSLQQPTVDWHSQLVQAEAKLLYEFHRWLRSAELFDIRAKIAQAKGDEPQPKSSGDRMTLVKDRSTPVQVDLFLTCVPIALSRFPWEAWEIGTEFGATKTFRIVRVPPNISDAPTITPSRHSRSRILAILGDETGLNFKIDREAVQSLSHIAEVQFVGWQPGQTAAAVQAQIIQKIEDEIGWDILFFAGHSNETQITGGELAIAPGTSLLMSEIAPHLKVAKERGLQFALFNSCSGLSIAESLIDLGLSQVAVMREPVHNQVAQEFLIRFLQNLAAHKDAHESLLAACQGFKLEKNFTYPSAYLLPSLFRHPDAIPFRIKPTGLKRWLNQALPTRWQAIALTATIGLSLSPAVQDFLLDRRVWTQAIYRDLTQQIPAETLPPVTLVQIDNKSIELSGMSDPNPIDRSYLAQLVDRLTAEQVKLIGVDYLLDRQQEGNDQVMAQSVQAAVNQQVWFTFAAMRTSMGDILSVGEATNIARPAWSLQGEIRGFPTYLKLPETVDSCYEVCPFAYLLSLVQATKQFANLEPDQPFPEPSLDRTVDLQSQLLNFAQEQVPPEQLAHRLRYAHFHPLTLWSWNFDQLWLRPIIDFSIPFNRAYNRLPAWELLTSDSASLSQLSEQVVIIAAGGYGEAGVDGSEDAFPMPSAMAYWRDRLLPETPKTYTGAEAHAYMVHHLLTQRIVIPIPDLWMVGVGIIMGKSVVILISDYQRQHLWSRKRRFYTLVGLVSATSLYGLVGLQVYLSAGILFPWILPSAIFWAYVLPPFRRKVHA
jgi:hypothetical protein